MTRRRYDRGRVAAAKLYGSISNLAAAERELAEEIVKRLEDGTATTDDLADYLGLSPATVDALIDLHRRGWKLGEPEPLPVTPAAMAADRQQPGIETGRIAHHLPSPRRPGR